MWRPISIRGIVALAKAGVQSLPLARTGGHRPNTCSPWVPAFAGMTEFWWDTDSVEFISGRGSKFFMAFGFTPANWQELKNALLDHPRNNPYVSTTTTPYGENMKFSVRCCRLI